MADCYHDTYVILRTDSCCIFLQAESGETLYLARSSKFDLVPPLPPLLDAKKKEEVRKSEQKAKQVQRLVFFYVFLLHIHAHTVSQDFAILALKRMAIIAHLWHYHGQDVPLQPLSHSTQS